MASQAHMMAQLVRQNSPRGGSSKSPRRQNTTGGSRSPRGAAAITALQGDAMPDLGNQRTGSASRRTASGRRVSPRHGHAHAMDEDRELPTLVNKRSDVTTDSLAAAAEDLEEEKGPAKETFKVIHGIRTETAVMPVVNEWEDADQRNQENERKRQIQERKTMHLMRRSTSRSRSASERAEHRMDHIASDIQEGQEI